MKHYDTFAVVSGLALVIYMVAVAVLYGGAA